MNKDTKHQTPKLTPEELQELKIKQVDWVKSNRKRMYQKKLQPCKDCKIVWHPNCMTFDHVGRKSMKVNNKGNPVNINSVTYWKPKTFERQLTKLDVICLNCHRIREFVRDVNEAKFSSNAVNKAALIKQLDNCTRGALIKDTQL